jgi:hypothetical protein
MSDSDMMLMILIMLALAAAPVALGVLAALWALARSVCKWLLVGAAIYVGIRLEGKVVAMLLDRLDRRPPGHAVEDE